MGKLEGRQCFKTIYISLCEIAGFHCHAIKINIKNHPLNEVKKLARVIDDK